MKYLKGISDFGKIPFKENNFLIENVNYHKTKVKNLGKVILPDPSVGDFKLSVMPFENNGKWVSLPDGFKQWEKSFNKILSHIPLQEGANTHYVTIDTKFFTTDEFLRREGVHMDGNFCVDPYFSNSIIEKASWGGASPASSWGGAKFKYPESKASWGGASWGGAKYKKELELVESTSPKYRFVKKSNNIHSLIRESKFEEKSDNSHVKMDWVLPYDIVIPISEYVSDKKGGILTVSTEVGCQAWDGDFYGEILSEGSFEKMTDQLTDDRKIIFEKNQLYFMTSNTPHETLLINKGKRRTFLRITLNHNYNNEKILHQ